MLHHHIFQLNEEMSDLAILVGKATKDIPLYAFGAQVPKLLNA